MRRGGPTRRLFLSAGSGTNGPRPTPVLPHLPDLTPIVAQQEVASVVESHDDACIAMAFEGWQSELTRVRVPDSDLSHRVTSHRQQPALRVPCEPGMAAGDGRLRDHLAGLDVN